MTVTTQNHSPDIFTVGICGSTENTVACATALQDDPRFQINWVITPPPRPVGRHQTITPSPLEQFAHKHSLETLHVDISLKELKPGIIEKTVQQPIDFLLVVDFGFLVPQWLLEIPRIAPINVHPSLLPKYRGSSPGQYALLYGETNSAVTIMKMDIGLDTGPIISQIPFQIDAEETQTSYYQKSFALTKQHLPNVLAKYTPEAETPQPPTSPTPLTKQFQKQDGYLPFSLVEAAQNGVENISQELISELSPILQEILRQHSLSPAECVHRVTRAFYPWPGAWTIVPTYKKRKNVREKIITTKIVKNTLEIVRWQFDGETIREIV